MSLNSSVLQGIQNRRSIRRYTQQPIADSVIKQLLTAATWAPSAHNRQPWRFVIIRENANKIHLAETMGQKLRRDLEADQIPQQIVEADLQRSYDRITLAPLVILLCLSMRDMDTYPDKQRAQNEYLMAVQSVAMAGQNLLLAAHELGLGACWMCAPLFCPEIVAAALQLPEDWQSQALLTLGYPAQAKEKTRHPLDSMVKWL